MSKHADNSNKSEKNLKKLFKPSKTGFSSSQPLSRRDFLKKTGLGALGVGFLFSPVNSSALNVKDSDFSVSTGADNNTLAQGLSVDSNQTVIVPNGNLDLQDNEVLNVGSITSNNGFQLSSEGLTLPQAQEGDTAPSSTAIAFDPDEGVLLVAEEVNQQ